jgi:hypothetical protein
VTDAATRTALADLVKLYEVHRTTSGRHVVVGDRPESSNGEWGRALDALASPPATDGVGEQALGKEAGMMDCGDESASHYAGCDCHEANLQEQIAALRTRVEELTGALRKGVTKPTADGQHGFCPVCERTWRWEDTDEEDVEFVDAHLPGCLAAPATEKEESNG